MNALRGRSKDPTQRKVSPPGPSYMSNDQFGMANPSSSPSSSPFSLNRYAPKRPSPLKESLSLSPEESLHPEPLNLHKKWTADYLSDLRSNRVARPSGARPLPTKTNSTPAERSRTPAPTPSPANELPPRSTSAMSTRRPQSSLSQYSTKSHRPAKPLEQRPHPEVVARDFSSSKPKNPLKPGEVVPTATYMERGSRWMEKEEAVALRDAMEDLDLKKREEEEARLQAAAQKEASELVWQHQHPGAIRPASDGPYRYKEHLRKNSYAKARTASVGPIPGVAPPTGLARDIPRSVSISSTESAGMQSTSRTPSGSSQPNRSDEPDSRRSGESVRKSTESRRRSGDMVRSTGDDKRVPKLDSSSRRRSSGRRNISGEVKTVFTGDQIWEEPEEVDLDRGRSTDAREVPVTAPLKAKTKPNRVSFAQDLPPRSESTPPEREPVKRPFAYSKYMSEIYKNPPSQSRNAAYTVNDSSVPTPLPEVPIKDGKEIRSDEIRQATSMRLSDRSPKLPTPTAVSDKPGRPIVSFDKNWTPPEEKVDLKAELRKPEARAFRGSPSPFDRSRRVGGGSSATQKSSIASSQTPKAVENQSVPGISIPDKPAGEVNGHASSERSGSSIVNVKPYSASVNVPSINVPSPPTTYVREAIKTNDSAIAMNFDSQPSKTNDNIPRISIDDPPKANNSIPTFSFSDPSESSSNIPEICISEPAKTNGNLPTFSISGPEISKPSVRAPMISVSEPPSKPTVNNSPPKSSSSGTRPLPDPRTVSSRPPPPRTNTVIPTTPASRGHWSPAPTHSTRATTLCHQCELPTERGAMRVSGQWFHPTCITCYQCNQALGHMDISAEPTNIRNARLARIARRNAGEIIEENENETIGDDGNEKLRFYCHLDWHELFAPRCHHCKTPIESGQDYQTAMGNVYHQGHFFCGECGDPFEEGVPYVKVDGYPWCVACATKRTERRAPKCRACRKAVVGEYTVALGGEWHLECFRCVGCAEPFGVDGRIFMRKDEETGAECACCLRCMEKEWKA